MNIKQPTTRQQLRAKSLAALEFFGPMTEREIISRLELIEVKTKPKEIEQALTELSNDKFIIPTTESVPVYRVNSF